MMGLRAVDLILPVIRKECGMAFLALGLFAGGRFGVDPYR
ncbi:hypothetical protein BPODLACK_03991 [Gordonia sp. YY1]|nr:hypothetical protein BPODLACK_03991 [Gordonia sp. YY1]